MGTWPWPISYNVRQGLAWNVVSATDHINVGIICYSGHEFPQYQKISNNCSTVRELFPIGRWAISTLVQFDCFSMRQGIDLGVRYSRISFLCLFRTDRPTYTISISKETTVLNKIKLILSKRNSNNDLDLTWTQGSTAQNRLISDWAVRFWSFDRNSNCKADIGQD